MQDDEEPFFRLSDSRLSYIAPKKCISHNPSPICFEKFYREYMIVSLPNLKILDNLPIRKVDREKAEVIFSQNFEYLPYKRKNKESVVSILQKRETRANHTRRLFPRRKSQYFYSRSLSAAKVGSAAWPALCPLPIMDTTARDDRRSYRPRQFEYHPSDASLMVFGTLDGEVIVINHESGKIVSYIPSLGTMNSVLGLCWLKNYPSKVYHVKACKLSLYLVKEYSWKLCSLDPSVHTIVFQTILFLLNMLLAVSGLHLILLII